MQGVNSLFLCKFMIGLFAVSCKHVPGPITVEATIVADSMHCDAETTSVVGEHRVSECGEREQQQQAQP